MMLGKSLHELRLEGTRCEMGHIDRALVELARLVWEATYANDFKARRVAMDALASVAERSTAVHSAFEIRFAADTTPSAHPSL
jgi:hypothetical protein